MAISLVVGRLWIALAFQYISQLVVERQLEAIDEFIHKKTTERDLAESARLGDILKPATSCHFMISSILCLLPFMRINYALLISFGTQSPIFIKL